ncbi:MAG: hypothetical protein APF80_17515 [Alphaproteobacteria bacterium BRH_c36]|nr:MAG: hypothetical protein APF80_17515 [Alphaproteobacteria bacterium BRH_c36]
MKISYAAMMIAAASLLICSPISFANAADEAKDEHGHASGHNDKDHEHSEANHKNGEAAHHGEEEHKHKNGDESAKHEDHKDHDHGHKDGSPK